MTRVVVWTVRGRNAGKLTVKSGHCECGGGIERLMDVLEMALMEKLMDWTIL